MNKTIEERLDVIEKRLTEIEDNNFQRPVERGICKKCGVETDSATSALDINYCGPCWNHLTKEERIQEGIEK